MKKTALIIFQKNRILGHVKTRLAATIGDEKAIEVYEQLLDKTYQEVKKLSFPSFVYFSESIEEDSRWNTYELKTQFQGDLGERMFYALKEIKALGFEHLILIGTDCYELEAMHLEEANLHLQQTDYVLGPACDGGYYLIACKEPDCELFLDKTWSTETVLQEALVSISSISKHYSLLAKLNDIDTEEDWLRMGK